MPRLTTRNPKYAKHRATGQAAVRIDGHYIYLGPYGTAASRAEYDRVIAEWHANGRRLPTADGGVTVLEIIAAYWKHAQRYYRRPDGTDSGECAPIRLALRPLRRLYGRTPAHEFGPGALKAVRDQMITAGWCRTNVNAQVGRIRRMFRWAAAEEMVPPAMMHGLFAVTPLKEGRSEARESAPVKPVGEPQVEATLPYLTDHVAAMVRLQLITGMRPGEACAMRWPEVDTTTPVWVYRPTQHKNRWRGHRREILIGPKAQEILAPFRRRIGGFLFSPAAAEQDRLADRAAGRVTPPRQGNSRRTNRVRRPQRAPGECYTVHSYGRAIARACEQAFVMPAELKEPKAKLIVAHDTAEDKAARQAARSAWRAKHVWSPHQLRHAAATRLRSQFGVEAAQVILGHKTLSVTELYAQKNVDAARRIMGEVG